MHYPNWHGPRDNLKLSAEVKHIVTRETGYQAVMKVRCSNGLQISTYHGNFKQQSSVSDLEFGTIDADKSVGVMFSYDGKLDPRLDAHFQCALLYTTASGERRVRCINTVASVSEGGAELMRYVDQDAVVCMIAKEGINTLYLFSYLLSNEYSCNADDGTQLERNQALHHRKDNRHLSQLSERLFF